MSKSDDIPNYAREAFFTFNEIMSNSKRGITDDMNRANKGELFVLHFLSERSEPVLPTKLSVALSASTGRVSALLRSLESKGQIIREIDKNDRRNILVTITPEGRQRAKTEMGEMQMNMARIFVEMGEADTMEFLRLTKLFFELSQKHMHC